MDRKPEMIAALAPREPQEAVTRDQGHIPGDSLGAAGKTSFIIPCRFQVYIVHGLFFIIFYWKKYLDLI